MSSTRQPGKQRGIGFVLLMSIVTFGIYSIYWQFVSYQEMRRWRGAGVNGFVGVLLALVVIGVFLLPAYVGRLYKEDYIERGDDPVTAARKAPISGWSGFLVFIPYVGGLVWAARLQGKLNLFWEAVAYGGREQG